MAAIFFLSQANDYLPLAGKRGALRYVVSCQSSPANFGPIPTLIQNGIRGFC